MAFIKNSRVEMAFIKNSRVEMAFIKNPRVEMAFIKNPRVEMAFIKNRRIKIGLLCCFPRGACEGARHPKPDQDSEAPQRSRASRTISRHTCCHIRSNLLGHD